MKDYRLIIFILFSPIDVRICTTIVIFFLVFDLTALRARQKAALLGAGGKFLGSEKSLFASPNWV